MCKNIFEKGILVIKLQERDSVKILSLNSLSEILKINIRCHNDLSVHEVKTSELRTFYRQHFVSLENSMSSFVSELVTHLQVLLNTFIRDV